MPKAKKKKYKKQVELDDFQKAEIVNKSALGRSVNSIAEEYGVSRQRIQRILEKCAEMLQECTHKKEETICQWYENQTSTAEKIIERCFELFPDKLKDASARDLAGVCKIMIDMLETFKKSKQGNSDNADNTEELTIQFVDNSGDDTNGD